MGVDFVNHVEAILEDVPTPILWRPALVGFMSQREDVELVGMEVGGVGVGIDVI